MIPTSVIIIALFLTIILVPIFSRLALRFGAVDMPEPRKIHALPMPRVGGAAMAIGAFFPIILWARGDDFVRAYLASGGIRYGCHFKYIQADNAVNDRVSIKVSPDRPGILTAIHRHSANTARYAHNGICPGRNSKYQRYPNK